MKTFSLITFSVIALSACSNTYQSKHECEKALAQDRGSIVGVLAGGQVGQGNGKAVGSVAGGVIGHVAGGEIYTADDDNDIQPYTRDRLTGIFTGCKPVDTL